ncbi:MAG: AAA family ATPase [Pleurocapsa sp. CRU_1_2]|nr:AAA family ATPase [Pleurocapsa sp. CRU_1_2]
MIVLSGGTKGGVGKSTVATNLAIMRSRLGRDVLLIDADDQETATDFTTMRNQKLGDAGYTCTQLNGSAVHTDGKRLAEKYDDVIIDAGGRDTASQRAALVIADVVLIPFVPRSFDVWTIEPVAQMIAEARAFNPELRAYAFINRADATGTENLEAAEYIQDTNELEFINTPLGYRKVFGKAASQGLSVMEYKPVDPKAIAEVTALFDLVFATHLTKTATYG